MIYSSSQDLSSEELLDLKEIQEESYLKRLLRPEEGMF